MTPCHAPTCGERAVTVIRYVDGELKDLCPRHAAMKLEHDPFAMGEVEV